MGLFKEVDPTRSLPEVRGNEDFKSAADSAAVFIESGILSESSALGNEYQMEQSHNQETGNGQMGSLLTEGSQIELGIARRGHQGEVKQSVGLVSDRLSNGRVKLGRIAR